MNRFVLHMNCYTRAYTCIQIYDNVWFAVNFFTYIYLHFTAVPGLNCMTWLKKTTMNHCKETRHCISSIKYVIFFLCVCVCSYSLSVIFVPLENWQISPTSCWVTGDICTCSWAWDCKEPLYCCQIDDHFRKLICKCVHVPSNTRHLFTQSFQLCSYYDIGIHSWCLDWWKQFMLSKY